MESKQLETRDLRHKNKGGRPSNEERRTNVLTDIKTANAELLLSLRNDLKQKRLTPTEKIQFLKLTMPLSVGEGNENNEDKTFDTYADKYLKIEAHIKVATQKPIAKEADIPSK